MKSIKLGWVLKCSHLLTAIRSLENGELQNSMIDLYLCPLEEAENKRSDAGIRGRMSCCGMNSGGPTLYPDSGGGVAAEEVRPLCHSGVWESWVLLMRSLSGSYRGWNFTRFLNGKCAPLCSAPPTARFKKSWVITLV